MKRNLSKSRILSGLQCRKRLWLEVHKRELMEVTTATQRLFDTGHQVGAIAQKMFPDGYLIERDTNLSEAIRETKDMLSNNPDTPLFEATFSSGGVLIRSDIFLKEENGYRIVEVKASTSVKDYYLSDTAVQKWVVEKAGYNVNTVELAHVDTSFVYQGNNDYNELLNFEDVTDRIEPLNKDVPIWANEFQDVLAGSEPDIEAGDQCMHPYECPFILCCIPESTIEYPVSLLPRIGKRKEQELINEGFEDIRDIPEGQLSNEKHERVRRVTISGKAEIDAELVDYLKGLPYPRYYIDFETIQFAVPIWKGTRPYQQLPVQWSCHIKKSDGEMDHAEFLDVSGNAPMENFIRTLITTVVGNEGPIIVYSPFEKSRLKELAEMYPEHKSEIDSIINRLVDLLPLLREYYYHPKMLGSWSIKAVLPCVAPELKYDDLKEVHDGGEAMDVFMEAIHPDTTDDRKEEIRKRLLEYCSLDTMAMVKIVSHLSK